MHKGISGVAGALLLAGCCGMPTSPAWHKPAAKAAKAPAQVAAATDKPSPAPSVADLEFLGQYAATFRFRLGRPRALTWLPDGSRLLYLRSPSRSFAQKLYTWDPASGREEVLLTAERLLGGATETLSAEEKARRERQRMAARGIARYRVSKDGKTLVVPLSGRIFLYDLGTRKPHELLLPGKGPVLDPRLSPDGKRLAWVRGGELWVMDLKGGKSRQLTRGASKHVTHGLAEFVAQEEMRRYRGYWWSPDSRMLVFQQTDVSGVERMHIHDPLHPEKPARGWPYPRPGKANAVVRLGVVSAKGGDVAWMDWDRKRWPYLTRVRWAKGAPLVIVVEDRAQQELAVLASRPAGGWQPLWTERDAAWLNLDPSMPRKVQGGWLWSTERDGAWALELRGEDGQLKATLLKAGQGYRKLIGVDAKRGEAWVLASPEPSEQHVVRVSLSGGKAGKPEKVTSGRGWHSATVARTGDVWAVHEGPVSGPARVRVVRRAGGAPSELPTEQEAPRFPVKPRFLTVGPRKVRAVVLEPRNKQPGRRYPVIVYAYGGPHYNVVRAHGQRYALQQWIADHGFIVCSFDGRGTPYRGRDWERATRLDLLSAPLQDQVDALRALAAKMPGLDLSRVGVFGWSFGGTFASAAVIRHPEVFKAGVAGAPVTDWHDYDTHYTERYIGLPGQQPGAYAVSSPITGAEKLKNYLMLIHGTADDNVWFSHSVKLSQRLFGAGVAHTFVPLPGHTHMVRDKATLERMYARIIKAFRENL